MSVSYLITLFNKEEFIRDVVDAALTERAQTGGELIIYDDVSTDRSTAIVTEHIGPNAAVARLIRADKNRGVGYATNFLIGQSAQPYTRLIDADDVLVRGSTMHMLRHLKENKLGFIHGMTTEVGNYNQDLEKQPFDRCLLIERPVRRILRHTIAGASPSLFVTEVLKSAAPVPEWIKRTQDFLITLRVANSGVPMGYVRDIVSVGPSQRTGNNLSASLAAMFAEMSRDVAHDGNVMQIDDLRYASRRYAARAAKYFRRRGRSRLALAEIFALWRWKNLAIAPSRQACIDRLLKSAEWLERDKDVLVTGPAR
ncbi:MAG: glycosyltransferase family 2 protein [Bdellovibrionales bacterium]